MNVDAILRHKGSTVVTIRPDTTVGEAVEILRRKGIGALVVSEDGAAVDGILSERDIIHALADHHAEILDATVDRLMTRRVFTCTPRDSIGELMAQMTERRIRHIPVLRNDALVGIVSIGDVVKHRLDEIEWEANSLRNFIAGN